MGENVIDRLVYIHDVCIMTIYIGTVHSVWQWARTIILKLLYGRLVKICSPRLFIRSTTETAHCRRRRCLRLYLLVVVIRKVFYYCLLVFPRIFTNISIDWLSFHSISISYQIKFKGFSYHFCFSLFFFVLLYLFNDHKIFNWIAYTYSILDG